MDVVRALLGWCCLALFVIGTAAAQVIDTRWVRRQRREYRYAPPWRLKWRTARADTVAMVSLVAAAAGLLLLS